MDIEEGIPPPALAQKKEKEDDMEENVNLTELDFKDTDSFKTYQDKHKMRPSTKVNIVSP